MSFFRNLFRATPVAAATPKIDGFDTIRDTIRETIHQEKMREHARILQQTPYQFFTVEEEAVSDNKHIAARQERFGRWSATATVDASKYLLRTLKAHGKTAEDANQKIRDMIVWAHKTSNLPKLDDINSYTRINVTIQTNTGNDTFSMTRNIMNTIMNIPGIESDVISSPSNNIRQVTWSTTNLRKYELAMFAYKDTNTVDTNHIDTMKKFIRKLEKMGRGTVTCTVA